MKQLILLCSTLHIEAFAQYITTTFRQDAPMPGLSVLWSGKTVRHDLGLIVIEGEVIPERLLDMIYVARDLFDFTEPFEGLSASPSPGSGHELYERDSPNDSS